MANEVPIAIVMASCMEVSETVIEASFTFSRIRVGMASRIKRRGSEFLKFSLYTIVLRLDTERTRQTRNDNDARQ